MAPSIPTHRPILTSGRIAVSVTVISVLSSIALLWLTPSEAYSERAAACAAVTVGGLL